MTLSTVAVWHELVRSRNVAGLDALLDDSVIFHSPVVHTPQVGKAVTTQYLSAAFHVFFNASSSTGSNNTYAWTFGDGSTGSGVQATHQYSQVGTFTVTLTATSDNGHVYASFNYEPALDLFQCVTDWDGAAWSECDPLGVDFNTHSNSMVSLGGADLAIAFSDATALSPVLWTRHGGNVAVRHVDAAADDVRYTTMARRADGALVVGYLQQGAAGEKARLAIVHDP